MLTEIVNQSPIRILYQRWSFQIFKNTCYPTLNYEVGDETAGASSKPPTSFLSIFSKSLPQALMALLNLRLGLPPIRYLM